MKLTNTIHIALSIWDPKGTYSRHAGATIASVLKNTEANVCFHILHDTTLSDENKNKLTSTAHRFNGEIDFIDVTPSMKQQDSVDIKKITGVFTPGSVFRLLLPDITDIEKIIYLDCDVIVNMDIAQMWQIPIENYCLAAVDDVSGQSIKEKRLFTNSRFRMWVMDMPLEHYFNSGVIMMNLKKIRKNVNLFAEGLKFFKHYAHCTEFPDQDLLNKLFQTKTLMIDSKFHVPTSRFAARPSLKDTIWHFTGEKPWNIHLGNTVEILYWQYLKDSAWGEQLIDHMLEARSSKYIHLHSSECYKKLCNRIRLNITKSMPANLLRVLWGELLYRLTK